jgi:hypothetical chaperone protein
MSAPYLAVDFGTSNCAAGFMLDQQPHLLALEQDGSRYLSSALYIERQRDPEDEDAYLSASLTRLLAQNSTVLVGKAAHERYSMDPLGGVFIRSPKSMLGSRLTPAQTEIYTQVATLLLGRIKQGAEQKLGHQVERVLIGRPIHFQGIDLALGDERALAILNQAASRVGFKEVDFAYEPVAAAIEYERHLTQEQLVLVVDIGGGTSDISLIRLGPEHSQKFDRSSDLLGHSGKRIGGVDMDIKLTIYGLMKLFGRQSLALDGKPLPGALFSDAVNIIDIHAQERFYAEKTYDELLDLKDLAAEPALLNRFVQVYQQHLSYYLNQKAEQAKIGLTEHAAVDVLLDRIDQNLVQNLSQQQLMDALYQELSGISKLIQQCLHSAGVKPDSIFVTGGASAVPGVQQMLQQLLPDVPVIRGDQFGSVAMGLSKLASLRFG